MTSDHRGRPRMNYVAGREDFGHKRSQSKLFVDRDDEKYRLLEDGSGLPRVLGKGNTVQNSRFAARKEKFFERDTENTGGNLFIREYLEKGYEEGVLESVYMKEEMGLVLDGIIILSDF